MGKQISLDNIVRVSVSGPARGLAQVNKNALALFTDEVPIPADYGTNRVYLNPVGVADDFGSTSETYALAVAVFGQTKNVTSGRGFLIVIPRLQSAPASEATILSSAKVNLAGLTAIDYYINVAVDGGIAADELIGPIDLTNIDSVQTSLNSTAVTAAGIEFVVTGDFGAANIELKSLTAGATSAVVIGLAGTGTDIAPVLNLSGSATGAAAGVERNKDAILRTVGSIPYFGICYNEKMADADLLETAALVQTLQRFQGVGSNLSADITGVFKTIKDSGFTKTRCFFYSTAESDSLDFAAGYMSQLMSINWTGTNTALTMWAKDYTGLVADPLIDDNLYSTLQKEGVDFLGDIGIPKILTSGANLYSDQVYSRLALTVDLQIGGINALAQTNTKIPQTEDGMNVLKGAYRTVLETHKTVGVYAPGKWNDPTTFGTPEDTIRNVAELGYYIYSAPIVDQSQAERSTRTAPLVQIAAKESGAIHTSDVSVLAEP